MKYSKRLLQYGRGIIFWQNLTWQIQEIQEKPTTAGGKLHTGQKMSHRTVAPSYSCMLKIKYQALAVGLYQNNYIIGWVDWSLEGRGRQLRRLPKVEAPSTQNIEARIQKKAAKMDSVYNFTNLLASKCDFEPVFNGRFCPFSFTYLEFRS